MELPTKPDVSRISTYAFTDHVAPSGSTNSEVFPRGGHDIGRGRKSLGSRPAKTFQPVLQNIRPRTYHGTGGRPVEQPFQRLTTQQDLESYKLFLSRPDDPDDVYELDIGWKNLLRAIPETAESRARDIARNSLDTISTFSEAFLKTPEPEGMRIEIWGDKEQCTKAKNRLQAWEGHLRSTGPRPSHKAWIKQGAFDGRREDRERQAMWREIEEQALQEADDAEFEYEAYLVWPKDHDLEAYLNKYEPSTLKDVAKTYGCRFKHERKSLPRFTNIQATAEANLLSVFQRLINLVKEMVAQKARGTHGNFCRLPSYEAQRAEVVIAQIGDNRSPFRPALSGSDKKEEDKEKWENMTKLVMKQTRTEIRSSMDWFFKALYVSQCHVRLRVSFGEILLREFTRSKKGNLTFDFDEFLGVLYGKRTEVYDPVLHDFNGHTASLVDTLFVMQEFQHPEESYRQVFEFKGTDVTNRLRLEIEMQPGYDFDEPEVYGQRWLSFKTYGQNENVLGLKMLDFEKPGFAIRADAYDIFTNDNIIKDMAAFRNAVSYKPSRDGVKAYPKLRSTFASHPKLVSVTEFTSTKFHFKDTDGILEFRREDTYMQDTGQPSKLPDKTRFELFYYYPEWDHLLGQLSDIKPGEDVPWERDIKTFFPDHMDADRPRSLPKGFKAFMQELYEIQDLLEKALLDLADQQQHDLTNS